MSLRFNGAEMLQRTSNAPAAEDVSYCMWARLRVDLAAGTGGRLLLFMAAGAGRHDCSFVGLASATNQSIVIAGTGFFITLTSTALLDEWLFIACTVTSGGSVSTFYARPTDTALTSGGTGTYTTGTTCDEMRLGRNQFAGALYNGDIEGFRLWQATLTQAELTNEMRRLTPGRTANLHFFLPTRGVAGAGTDYSGNGYSFSVTGTFTEEENPPVRWRPHDEQIIYLPDAGISGSVSAAMQPYAADAAGAETFTGAADAALTPYASTATGAETFTGAADAAAQPFAADATGTLFANHGSADAAMSSFAATATGAETFSGTGSAACTPFAADATGAETFAGTVGAALTPFACDAEGAIDGSVSGSASAAASSFASAATGAETFTGSVDAVAQPFAATAAGFQGQGGSATAEMSPFAASSTGLETFAGSVDAACSSFAAAATGTALLAITGSATATISSFACSGTGTHSFTITGTASAALSPFACTGTQVFNTAPRARTLVVASELRRCVVQPESRSIVVF